MNIAYSGRMRPQALRPNEYLEKLLNRSTLTTQRVTHTNVIKVGSQVLKGVDDDEAVRHQQEMEEAIRMAELRAQREMEAAMKRLNEQLEARKKKELAIQKLHLGRLAERVRIQRDKLEAERIDELTKKMNNDKEEALKLQWDEAERQKSAAVKKAWEELTIKLNREHRLDKEIGIAEALSLAREKFRQRKEQAIAETKSECERLAAQEADRVAQLHADEIQRHNIRYSELKDKYEAEHSHRRRVENDFNSLQTDYQRFMNYTDGKYHSDYMMQLRRHGWRLSEKRQSDVSEYTEKVLSEIKLPLRRTANKS